METTDTKIKEYAEGWITEREGAPIPAFLKLAFGVIAAGCLAYLLMFMNGEVDHPDRGKLVQALNAATEASGALMYAIAAIMVIFGVIVVAFSLRKDH
jgi:hypothetical protein